MFEFNAVVTVTVVLEVVEVPEEYIQENVMFLEEFPVVTFWDILITFPVPTESTNELAAIPVPTQVIPTTIPAAVALGDVNVMSLELVVVTPTAVAPFSKATAYPSPVVLIEELVEAKIVAPA